MIHSIYAISYTVSYTSHLHIYTFTFSFPFHLRASRHSTSIISIFLIEFFLKINLLTMSGKINKKSKGTNQQPPVEPREPLNRELFKNTTPKSDRVKDKKRKRGVGESLSESPKDNESLERIAASSSDDEQGDDADLSESQDLFDLNKIKIGKKPLSSNGLKGASGKNQTAGDDEKVKLFMS